MGKLKLLSLVFIVCFASLASAQPPHLVSYQGKLMDSNGVPISGVHDLQFDIYTSSTGGTSLWSEEHSDQSINAGLFSVILGNRTLLDPDAVLDANDNLWLEVTLDETETFTRTRLVSSAFAILASRLSGVEATAAQLNELVGGGPTVLHSHAPGDANTLDSLDSTQFLRSDASTSYSIGTLEVASGATLNVAGVLQIGGIAVNATAAQLNELVGGGATSLHSHAAGDADTLDSLDSTQFLRSDVDDTCAANLTVSGVFQAGTALASAAYNRLGDGTPTQAAINAANDLLINGDLEVKGTVNYGTKTGYFTVNSSDPLAYDDAYTFTRGLTSLYKDSGSPGFHYFYAPVNLPNGAIVTELTFWYNDTAASDDLDCDLYRRSLNSNSWAILASASSSGSAGSGSNTDSTISYATVDNSNYTYVLRILFDDGDTVATLEFYTARITYTTTSP